MEHTWTKDFYQETDPVKRQQILKEHIGEEEAWEEEYRARLWTVRYGQRRLQKDEFVKCLMELKYLAEGTSLDLGGDRRKTGARILSTLCLAEAMQSNTAAEIQQAQPVARRLYRSCYRPCTHYGKPDELPVDSGNDHHPLARSGSADLSGIRHGTIVRRRNREKNRRTDQCDRVQGTTPASHGKRIHPAPGSRPPGISAGVSEQGAFSE